MCTRGHTYTERGRLPGQAEERPDIQVRRSAAVGPARAVPSSLLAHIAASGSQVQSSSAIVGSALDYLAENDPTVWHPGMRCCLTYPGNRRTPVLRVHTPTQMGKWKPLAALSCVLPCFSLRWFVLQSRSRLLQRTMHYMAYAGLFPVAGSSGRR
jgi:hypothetical protein